MEPTSPPATQRRTGSSAARLAQEVSDLQAILLGRLHAELGADESARFATAAQRLAREFGAVTATAVGSVAGEIPDEDLGPSGEVEGARAMRGSRLPPTDAWDSPATEADAAAGPATASGGASGLLRSGEVRHRLDQLVETHKRYDHPFGLAVFDADGPGVRNGGPDADAQSVRAVFGAALHDSVRLVDETFWLGDGALCVLAPNQNTVGGVRMTERLLEMLDQLEAAGGLRIAITAGVVACPEHGSESEELLRKADEAMWRARAVGQPVGVGTLEN